MPREFDEDVLGAFAVPEPSADLEDRVWAAHVARNPASSFQGVGRRALAFGGVAVVAAAVLVAWFALRPGSRPSTPAVPKRLSMAELDAIASGDGVRLVDANPGVIRDHFGSIPGSIQLGYDGEEALLVDLPADKDATLVFYSANETCPYAPAAAERAVRQGYSDVYILPAGIIGWTDAGRPTE